jgi:hypothetical protein
MAKAENFASSDSRILVRYFLKLGLLVAENINIEIHLSKCSESSRVQEFKEYFLNY